jgi:hypothetical protein
MKAVSLFLVEEKTMNFNEIIELLRALSIFHLKRARTIQWEHPKIVPHDASSRDYALEIKKDTLEPDYLSFLERIVETRQYRLRNHSGYLSIRSS